MTQAALNNALALIDSAIAEMNLAKQALIDLGGNTAVEPLPIILTENILKEFAPVTVSGAGGENVQAFSFDCAERDLVIYLKAKLSGVFGEAGVLSIENADRSRTLQVGIGYNFATLAQQDGRVSLRAQANNAYQAAGISGQSTSMIEIRLHMDADRGYLNLWLRDGANWKWVDSCQAPRFQIDQIRCYTRTAGPANQSVQFCDVWACLAPAVSIGDSVTAGHNSYDPTGLHYAGVDNGKSQWQAHCFLPGMRNSVIINKGIGGQSTAQVNARIAEAHKHGAPLVFLSVQNNDHAKGVTLEQRTANIQASITACVNAGCSVVLYGAIYPNNNAAGAAYYKQWRNDHLPLLQGYTHYIEVMDALAEPVSGNVSSAYSTDGTHLNVTGYSLMGQRISNGY